ncbi:MAG TPA: hypothetical protein VIY86_02935, partial [Pirellulaceae bacterium]
MILALILLADLDDIIRVLILAAFILGPLLSRLGKPRAAAPPPAPRRGRPRGGPAGPAAQPNPLEVELERILREVAAKEPRVKDPRTGAAPATRDRPPKPRTSNVTAPEKTQSRRRPRLSDEVSEHVQEHLGTHPVSDHAQSLGKSIGQADERVENELASKFSHGIGQFASPASVVAATIAEGTDSEA